MSFGTSPTAPSLLIPSNPAFSTAEYAPKGGILINVHRASEPTLSIDSTLSPIGGTRRPSDPSGSPITEESPLPSPSTSTSHNQNLVNNKGLKIRFAPLPDPRRPRSLSTGRNIAWTNEVDENGLESRHYTIKDHNTDDYAVDDQVFDDDDDENEGEKDGEGEDDDEDGKRGSRRWSKSMGLGSSWKASKKLLTGKNPMSSSSKDKDKDKDKDDILGYGQGAPLKKSVSTGGFIGSSPFRWASETERRNTMQGTSPPTVTSLLSTHRSSASGGSSSGHRRNSSLEPGGGSLSPATPIKMMNGRVYGSRRASEAAEREKQLRERNEPAFVEWGQGHSVGSNSTTTASTTIEEGASKKGSFLGDNDDGGGMAWVKRRREERRKKEEEERERKEKEQQEPEGGGDSTTETSPIDNKDGVGVGLSSSQSSTSSSVDLTHDDSTAKQSINLKTPAIETRDLPPTPIIRVSDSDTIHSPQAQHQYQQHVTKEEFDVGPKGERMTPTPPSIGTGSPSLGKGLPQSATELIEEKNENDHVVQAMRIPSGGNSHSSNNSKQSQSQRRSRNQLSDPFGQESPTRSKGSYDDDDDDSEEEEEEDEEDDGDFDDDEEEEVDLRTTSSAAGVEVISRHK
ncbi:uncharacterized protein L201_003016 [Kwoniella dendrophila CBS 6074]|uniref:Transcription elongation factor Eaf N-terminal domain-containing protein n=1 Tax=Kwoniella dendrophila CBS 6074 TaxID=1295534 RepID=A0AAX4JRT0_9TREE